MPTEDNNINERLAKDYSDVRMAGCELAAAASFVIGNHDGLHRLSIAVAKFLQTVANEGGRGERYKENGK